MGEGTTMSLDQFFNELENGTLRSAQKINGSWVAQIEVKQKILEAFKEGVLKAQNGFVDKHNLFPQEFTVERGVRLVPGGTSVRRGSYIAKGVVIMPPSYINVGAYIDEGSMVDSHVLVGSCAQIGKKVHLSAGVQIGGVLEPIGQKPVVIEDEVFVGAGSVIVEGITVRARAVIAPGVILSKAVQVYDVVHDCILERGADIPEGAVVVPGSRKISQNKKIVSEHQLSLSCPIIIKYRDNKTDVSLTLEDALR
jgi:2,3,4,5-tetrahydropyridine-2,6-dicarboxylate N-succinyltransferase